MPSRSSGARSCLPQSSGRVCDGSSRWATICSCQPVLLRPPCHLCESTSSSFTNHDRERCTAHSCTSGPDTRRAGCGSAQPNPGWLSSRTLPPPAASPTSVTKMQPAPSFEFSSAKSAPPAEPQETELFSTGWQIDLHVECCLAVVDTTFAVHRPLC